MENYFNYKNNKVNFTTLREFNEPHKLANIFSIFRWPHKKCILIFIFIFLSVSFPSQ